MNMNFLLLSSDPAPYLDMGNYLNLVSLIMAIIIFAGFDTVLFFWLKRSFVRTFLVASELAIVLFWLFGLDLLLFIVLAFFIVGVSFFSITRRRGGSTSPTMSRSGPSRRSSAGSRLPRPYSTGKRCVRKSPMPS